MISPKDYRNLDIQPLDLIFFKGSDFISDTVSITEDLAVGNGDFSHVGLIVTKELLNLEFMIPEKKYILESTVSYSDVNLINGKRTSGVQIRSLNTTIEYYLTNPKCKIAWGKLRNNPFIKNKEETKKKFLAVFNKYKDSQYDFNCFNLLAAAFKRFRPIRNAFTVVYDEFFVTLFGEKDWVFCSELVAIIYNSLGITKCNPRDVIPMDFLGYDIDGLPMVVYKPVYIK